VSRLVFISSRASNCQVFPPGITVGAVIARQLPGNLHGPRNWNGASSLIQFCRIYVRELNERGRND